MVSVMESSYSDQGDGWGCRAEKRRECWTTARETGNRAAATVDATRGENIQGAGEVS